MVVRSTIHVVEISNICLFPLLILNSDALSVHGDRDNKEKRRGITMRGWKKWKNSSERKKEATQTQLTTISAGVINTIVGIL